MEAEQIIEKKVYEEGKRNYATKGEALGVGIPALALAGIATANMLFGRGRGIGLGGVNMPENINIVNGGMTSGLSGLTPFSVWEKECGDVLRLSNRLWEQEVGTMKEMYAHRDADINEKFALYKGQRDSYDSLKAELDGLKQSVAINAAIRPYQDKLIQCEIEKAYTAGVNYVDRKTCRMITGEVVLPNTPVVSGYASYSPFSCNCQQVAAPSSPASAK